MIQKKVFLSCLENLLHVENLATKIGQHQHRFILTNKRSETLKKHKDLIEVLDAFENIEIIPNYTSALKTIKNKNKNPILLVGDPHHQLHEEIREIKVITLEETCAIFPEKVPLSYRPKDSKQIKQRVEKRLGIDLNKEPPIKNILVTSHDIKMWDQAIQVILDLQPASIVVEYEKHQQSGELEDLSMKDFIGALQTCHEVIYGTPLPRLENFNENNKHLRWILTSRSLDQAENVVIDEDLVCKKGQLVGIKGQIKKVNPAHFL